MEQAIMGRVQIFVAAAAVFVVAASPASADLVISKRPTANVHCSLTTVAQCNATAPNANLNIGELRQYLKLPQGAAINAGAIARDLVFDASLSWSKKNNLILMASHAVVIKKPITVTGTGEFSIRTTPPNGEFVVAPGGRIDFWDTHAKLYIGDQSFTLVNDLATLAAAVTANPAGHFALARDYDASADGAYTDSVVRTSLTGGFDGLGHTIRNLDIQFGDNNSGPPLSGLFALIQPSGRVANIGVENATLGGTDSHRSQQTGIVAGVNSGLVTHVWATGSVTMPENENPEAGGLVGVNTGTVSYSHVNAAVSMITFVGWSGGITSINTGTIDSSYSEGSITAADNNYVPGGVAGDNRGLIRNCYSLAAVAQVDGHFNGDHGWYGGLAGLQEGVVVNSYAAGLIAPPRHTDTKPGGAAGYVNAGTFRHVYWDLDTGVSDPSQGAGNQANYPGITGLTTAALKAALPAGFDPKIWAQDANVNSGLPYLISNH